MRGMNRVTLVGNAGKDPDTKVLGAGIAVAKVSLATTDLYRLKDGSTRSDTQWHTVVFWRGLAELVGKYLRKGSRVLIEGRVCYRKYEDKAGGMRYITEIVADKMLLLDRRVQDTAESVGGVEIEDLPF